MLGAMDDSAPALRSNRQRFFDFLLLLVTMAPLVVAGLFATDGLSRRWCPPGTFLWGTTLPQLRLVAVVLFAFAGGYLVVRLLLRMIPALAVLTGYPAPYSHASRAGSWSRFWLYFAGAWMLAGLLLLLATAAARFCLAPGAISSRDSPWGDSITYDWQDAIAIQTSCSRGARGSWSAAYLLVLRDGAAIDLLASEPRFRDGYLALVRALRARDVRFDASRVAADCGHQDVDLLRHAPR